MLFSWTLRNEQQQVSPDIQQVYLELSTFCNLSCRTCVRNSIVDFQPSYMSQENIKKILPMLSALGKLERIVLLGYGEALCNPAVKEILTLLRELQTRIVLVTNATFLTEEMSAYLVHLPLDEIFVSWDDDIRGETRLVRPNADASVFKKNVEGFIRIRNKAGLTHPLLGLEIVAMRGNYQHIRDTIKYGAAEGIEKFIVTGLFPYSDEMKDEILYAVFDKPDIRLKKILRREMKKYDLRVAENKADTNRRCPFIENGTIFITSNGDVSPCLELAYRHGAYYFGSLRMHDKFNIGSINDSSIEAIWNSETFESFRSKFPHYDFPDCSTCYEPDRCYHRTEEVLDCYHNQTPCGECLWAKDIVLCP